jgi:hypothetical protein
MLNKWPQTFYTDNFTPPALVSHNTGVPKEQLPEIDMLPQWKNKLVLLRTMTELTILGLVDMYPRLGTEDNDEHYNEEKKIVLKDEFKTWLNKDEFKKLRKGIVGEED